MVAHPKKGVLVVHEFVAFIDRRDIEDGGRYC